MKAEDDYYEYLEAMQKACEGSFRAEMIGLILGWLIAHGINK